VSTADVAYLAARTPTDFLSGGHRTYFQPSLAAVAGVSNDIANAYAGIEAYSALVSATYTLMLSISGGSLGIGTEGLDVPVNTTLGSAAFADIEQIVIRRVVTQDAAYQVVAEDFWTSMLLTTSGTRTYTMPAWSSMPDFVPPLIGKNRSGANLTLARTGSDTFDAAATFVTVPTGSSWEIYKSPTSGLWESRVFA
jgi:hypothetical protein